MDPSVITAFVALLTPLGGMAVAIFTLMSRRISALEEANAELLGFAITSCQEKAENMERLATLIARDGGKK
jgi:hypothetical protein